MALTFESSKTATHPSHEALKNHEGEMGKPTVDEVAGSSAKRANERMKQNENAQGIFSK